MNRPKLNVTGNMRDTLVQMAEGNPGGLSVLMKLLALPDMEGFGLLLDLDDMNMRGSQIWVAWKDHCHEDLEKFKTAVRARDPAMVSTVNSQRWPKDTTPLAVTSGASFEHVA
jgi:DNA-binding transcriptional LysR family regulator